MCNGTGAAPLSILVHISALAVTLAAVLPIKVSLIFSLKGKNRRIDLCT